MLRSAPLAVLFAVCATAVGPGQERADDPPLIRGQRCACGQPIEPTPFQRVQRADGRFPVAGEPRAELRFTAVACLAMVGDGSSRGEGPYSHQLQHAVEWLERRIDARGRIGFGDEPGWLPVSLIAGCALAEEAVADLAPEASGTLAALVEGHARELVHRAAVDAETLWWADWLCRASACYLERRGRLEEQARGAGAPLPQTAWFDVAPLREVVDVQIQRCPDPESFWQRALLDELKGERRAFPPAARYTELLDAEPRACFHLMYLAWCRGGETWEQVARQLGQPIAPRMPSNSNGIPFDEDRGWDFLSTEYYYRYSRLRRW